MANGTATRSAPNVPPRVYPAGRAVLLLAICGAELAGRRLTVEGRRVQVLPFGRFALLVAFVDQEAYSAPQIARKRDDAAWLGAEARAYQHAIERAQANGPVLPMKLLTVLTHTGALEDTVREHEARWSRALTRLAAKRECVVHLYLGPHVPPGEEAYVVRVSGRASRAGRAPTLGGEPHAVEHALSTWRACTGLALAARRIAPVPSRGSLFSTALLLAEKDVATLRESVGVASVAGVPFGVTTYFEGPRLPYTFVP